MSRAGRARGTRLKCWLETRVWGILNPVIFLAGHLPLPGGQFRREEPLTPGGNGEGGGDREESGKGLR